MYKVLLALLLVSSLYSGYIGKEVVYTIINSTLKQKKMEGMYIEYIVQKKSLFSISKHRVFKNVNNEWYDILMDNPKYLGMTYNMPYHNSYLLGIHQKGYIVHAGLFGHPRRFYLDS